MNRISKMKAIILQVVFSLILFENVIAQTSESVPVKLIEFNIFFFILAIILIIIAFEYFGTESGVERPARVSLVFRKIKSYITGLAPLEKEKDLLLDHDYDGIKELDNRIPPWFNYLFIGTIIFAVYYMLDYHVLGTSMLSHEEYALEMKLASLQREKLIKSGAFLNEDNVTLLTDETSLSRGKEIYMSNCLPCHGEFGQGTVGPNLTDEFWIHGGGIKNIFITIKYGVQAKGMISWQGILNPNKIQEVASYVISLEGTDPPNPKQPEGVKYTEQVQ
jgi:cytochrome c oxidase cbb3-type subunit 3